MGKKFLRMVVCFLAIYLIGFSSAAFVAVKFFKSQLYSNAELIVIMVALVHVIGLVMMLPYVLLHWND